MNILDYCITDMRSLKAAHKLSPKKEYQVSREVYRKIYCERNRHVYAKTMFTYTGFHVDIGRDKVDIYAKVEEVPK